MKKYADVKELEETYYSLLYHEIRALALSIFEWTNLPEGMRSEQIERTLFDKGEVLFFMDDALGYLVLPIAPEAHLNVYGQPIRWRAIGATGYNKRYDIDNSVLIRNTEERKPTNPIVEYLVQRLVDIELTIINNVNWLKVPYVFQGDEKNISSFKAFFKKVTQNHPVVYTDKSIANDNLVTHPTATEYQGENLVKLKHEYLNDLYTALGLKTANTDKKERLIVDEVDATTKQAESNMHARLSQRQKAVENINSMYGLDVGVRLRGDDTKDEKGSDDNVPDENRD